jgi:hypothetical protein
MKMELDFFTAVFVWQTYYFPARVQNLPVIQNDYCYHFNWELDVTKFFSLFCSCTTYKIIGFINGQFDSLFITIVLRILGLI